MEEANVNPSDQEAAMAIINGHPFLSHDNYARKVVEDGGKVASGKIVDMRDFLTAKGAILEMDAIKEKDPIAYEAAMVVSSVRPDVEKWIN